MCLGPSQLRIKHNTMSTETFLKTDLYTGVIHTTHTPEVQALENPGLIDNVIV